MEQTHESSLEVEEVEQPLFSWEISSHDERERTTPFYIVAFCIMIALLVFALWQKNFLFGVFVILAMGTFLFLSMQPSDIHSFSLTNTELIIGHKETQYTYNQFDHFDIVEFSPDDCEIYFVFKDKLKPLLHIRMYRVDIPGISQFLSTKITRATIDPPFIDIFSKIIGI